MASSNNNYSSNPSYRPYKRSALAIAILAASAGAVAQNQESPAALEEVIVTGVRANLENAQEIKRNADTFIDAISAEDMGSLPNRSVLEAI